MSAQSITFSRISVNLVAADSGERRHDALQKNASCDDCIYVVRLRPERYDATPSLFKEVVPMGTEVRCGLLGTERPWEEALNSLASRQRDRGAKEQKSRVLRG